jgi:RNA recognition motif-containing protein
MAKKLFVGNLSWNTRDETLKSAFDRFGAISEAKVIMDRVTGRSRGFGFVTFDDDANADQAKTEMDGKDLDGRTIRVDFPRDREGGGGGGGDRGGRGGRDRY